MISHYESGAGSLAGSSESLIVLDTFKTKDLPLCLRELGEFLDKIYHESNQDTSGNPDQEIDFLTAFGEQCDGTESETAVKWLTVHKQIFQRSYREILPESIDSNDYECPLCMRTLWKPITTPCGHSFCKTCLDRVLDHNTNCPMCKSATLKSYLSERRETMSNEFLDIAMKLYLPTEYGERMKIHENEMQVYIYF